MPLEHEFDWADYGGCCPALLSEQRGIDIANDILSFVVKQGQPLSQGATLLGLGAGYAIPELGCARRLGIPDSRVTLVDKKDAILYPAEVKRDHPELTYRADTGVFGFLTNPSQKFNVVTAFGLENLLGTPERIMAFIKLLPQAVSPFGYVCVLPYFSEVSSATWNEHGFQPVAVSYYKLEDVFISITVDF